MILAARAHGCRGGGGIGNPGMGGRCRRRARLPSRSTRSPQDRAGPGACHGWLLNGSMVARAIPGHVGPVCRVGVVGCEGTVRQNSPLSCRRRKLGQPEVGRGRLEAALEVVKADRGKEVEGSGGVGYVVGKTIPAAKGKQRVIVGGRGAKHWGVDGGPADGSDLGGTGIQRSPESSKKNKSKVSQTRTRAQKGRGMLSRAGSNGGGAGGPGNWATTWWVTGVPVWGQRGRDARRS